MHLGSSNVDLLFGKNLIVHQEWITFDLIPLFGVHWTSPVV